MVLPVLGSDPLILGVHLGGNESGRNDLSPNFDKELSWDLDAAVVVLRKPISRALRIRRIPLPLMSRRQNRRKAAAAAKLF